MSTYDTLRHFADSWMLLVLVLVFLGVIVWAFRPGSRKDQDEAATAIFRNEDSPAPDAPRDAADATEKEAKQ
jgi:cytochrome c oxidase cbb3-type subunit 4